MLERTGGGFDDAIAFSCKDHGTDAGEVSPTLRSMNSVNSNDADGGQVAIAFHNRQDPDVSGDVTHPIGRQDNGLGIAVDCYNGQVTGDVAATMGTPGSSVNASGPTLMQAMKVRRLTPLECERLQGFPDGWTEVPYRGKPAADGPRYKALGNSMAVNCMSWIGDRIQQSVERNGG